jgi:hypothetical protein
MAFNVNDILTGKQPTAVKPNPMAPAKVFKTAPKTFYRDENSSLVTDNTGHKYTNPQEFFNAGGKWENVQVRKVNPNVAKQLTGGIGTSTSPMLPNYTPKVDITSKAPQQYNLINEVAKSVINPIGTIPALAGTKPVLNFAKGVAQGTATSGAVIGQGVFDVAKGMTQGLTPTQIALEVTKQKTKQLDPNSLEGKISNILFGRTDMPSISQYGKEAASIIPGGEGFAQRNPNIAFGLGLGMAALDFTGAGKAKNAAKVLALTKDLTVAEKILKEAGVADNLVKEFAPQIVKTTDEVGIQRILKQIETKAKPSISKYRIIKEDGIKEVEGEPVKISEGLDTFIHQDENKNWVVSEATTGRDLTNGGFENKTFAIKAARDNVFGAGEGMKGEMWSAPEIVALDKSIIKTKSQLTDIWKKANEVEAPKTQTPKVVSDFNPEKYVAEQVAKSKEVPKSGIVQKAKDFVGLAKRKLVDFAAPIEDTLSKFQKDTKSQILPKYDITNQIDRVLRSPTLAGQFARDNGLEQVIKKVDNLDNLDQYLIAKQAIKVGENGITTGRDLAKDKALVEAFAPKYEEMAKTVNQYSQKLLDESVNSGLISKDLATALKAKYPDYVPLQRVFSELEKSPQYNGGKAIASLSKQTIVQRLVGSERDIQSPIQSLLEKTTDVFKQGEKNKAAQILTSYKDLPGNPFSLRELKDGESATHTVSVLDNGVKRTFETTPDIANAAKALNVQQMNILGKIFALPTRIAKVGITGINLPFVGANIVKDQVTAFINSSEALKTSIGNPMVYLKSLFEAVGHGKVYEEMAREGALGTSFDIARNQVAPTIEKLRAGRSVGSKIKYTVKHPSELLRAVEDIIGRSEEFTRIKQYAGTKKALLEKGMSEADARIGAAKAARGDTVNFARRGEWGQVLNSAFLYLNASIQGTRTFLRTAKDKPVQTAAKLAIAGFTPMAVATAWNLSDPKRKEAYNDISEFEKQGNLIFIPPNPHKNEDGTWDVIKIPLSQEINNIVSIPRRAIEQAYGLDPVSVGDIVGAFVGTISPINPTTGSLASTLTPQAIKPTIESLTNKSLFTGKAQVPDFMTKLSPDQQVFDNTSGTARKIAGLFGASPIKTENFVRGTFGGVGSQLLNTSDRLLAKAGTIPKDQIGGQNVVDAILGRFSKARGSFVDPVKNKLQPTFDKVQQLKAEGKNNEASAIVEGLSNQDYETYKELKTVYNQQVAQKALDMKLTGNEQETEKLVDAMTDDQYKVYQNLKTKTQEAGGVVEEAIKSDSGIIHLIGNYAKAFQVDPQAAFKTLFTKESLRKVVNDAVIMDRISLEDSQNIKKKLNYIGNQKLDHTIPLELGGTNDESNLKLVEEDVWKSYSPIENLLGKALSQKKINKKEAQQLIKDFKDGKISEEELRNKFK